MLDPVCMPNVKLIPHSDMPHINKMHLFLSVSLIKSTIICFVVILQRNSRKKRKFDGYAVELTDMNDRLEVVEKKINELERSIPQEIEEWRKLQKVSCICKSRVFQSKHCIYTTVMNDHLREVKKK